MNAEWSFVRAFWRVVLCRWTVAGCSRGGWWGWGDMVKTFVDQHPDQPRT